MIPCRCGAPAPVRVWTSIAICDTCLHAALADIRANLTAPAQPCIRCLRPTDRVRPNCDLEIHLCAPCESALCELYDQYRELRCAGATPDEATAILHCRAGRLPS